MLRWVWEYCGPVNGIFVAAGTGTWAGEQVGVSGLGYSSLREAGASAYESASEGSLGDSVIDARILVHVLRMIGRMGHTDNFVRGLPSIRGRQFLVEKDGRLVCLQESESGADFLEVNLDDDLLVE